MVPQFCFVSLAVITGDIKSDDRVLLSRQNSDSFSCFVSSRLVSLKKGHTCVNLLTGKLEDKLVLRLAFENCPSSKLLTIQQGLNKCKLFHCNSMNVNRKSTYFSDYIPICLKNIPIYELNTVFTLLTKIILIP